MLTPLLGVAQVSEFDLQEVRSTMTRILQRAIDQPAQSNAVELEFVSYYNQVARTHPGETLRLNYITNEVAKRFGLGYRIKGHVMQSAEFSDDPVRHVEPIGDPDQDPASQIFLVVQHMPRFPGCEDLDGSESDKAACARELLLEFIKNNLAYPETSYLEGIEGRVVVQFVVGADGTPRDLTLLRGIDPACDSEALRVAGLLLEMQWIPGRQRDTPVDVAVRVPVEFRL